MNIVSYEVAATILDEMQVTQALDLGSGNVVIGIHHSRGNILLCVNAIGDSFVAHFTL